MSEKRLFPPHKPNRLEGYDYGSEGVYFLTICTENRRSYLSRIVARGILDAPETVLTSYGRIVEETLLHLDREWRSIHVQKYVIMPNHLHILLQVTETSMGASGMPRATDAVVPRFVSSIKRFTNRSCGIRLWQKSYYDHIIRDEADYLEHFRYIEDNPAKWLEDQYYMEETL